VRHEGVFEEGQLDETGEYFVVVVVGAGVRSLVHSHVSGVVVIVKELAEENQDLPFVGAS
jgi:hypothetical protein